MFLLLLKNFHKNFRRCRHRKHPLEGPKCLTLSLELMVRQPLIEKKVRVFPFAAEWSQGNTKYFVSWYESSEHIVHPSPQPFMEDKLARDYIGDRSERVMRHQENGVRMEVAS